MKTLPPVFIFTVLLFATMPVRASAGTANCEVSVVDKNYKFMQPCRTGRGCWLVIHESGLEPGRNYEGRFGPVASFDQIGRLQLLLSDGGPGVLRATVAINGKNILRANMAGGLGRPQLFTALLAPTGEPGTSIYLKCNSYWRQ